MRQLMDQMQFIQECKASEMQRGIENGYVDQKKIDEYDEQLKALEQKMTEALMKEAAKGAEEEDAAGSKNKVLTEEEYERKKFTDLMDLSSGVRQSEVVLSAKKAMDGEANVLKAEIKSDGDKASASKLERVSEIEARSSGLLEQVGEKLADINSAAAESGAGVHREDEDSDREETTTEHSLSAEDRTEEVSGTETE